jgi:hypothetical protein
MANPGQSAQIAKLLRALACSGIKKNFPEHF